jgi:hypothetical protein
MKHNSSSLILRRLPRLVLLLGLAASGCGTSTTSTTACSIDNNGNQVCANYSSAYPYDYAYVDPLYSTSGGYYPYTVDTYYDPAGYNYVGYQVTLSDGGASGDAGTGADAAATGDGGVPMGTAVPELVDRARRAANGVNTGIRAALDAVRDLIKTTPTQTKDPLIFGPANHGNGNYQLTIHKVASMNNRFGWKLEARAANSTGGFALVAGGVITVVDQPRRGRGAVGVDCDALSAADSSVTCKGKERIGFANVNGNKILAIALDAYTPNSAAVMPLDATAFAFRTASQANSVRLATRANLSFTATAAEETVALKLRWTKDVGVRVDAVAEGGDIASGQLLRASTCIGPTLDPASASTSIETCSADGSNCTPNAGSTATPTCPTGLDMAELPNPSATAVDPPMGQPEMPTAPATIPDGSGN